MTPIQDLGGTLTVLPASVYSPPSLHAKRTQALMATATAGTSNTLYWLALALTPGLGPTRGRKLVEHFVRVEDIFHAPLTELEALHLQAQSAQHIALGKSLELAHEEYAKAVAAGIRILSREDQG